LWLQDPASAAVIGCNLVSAANMDNHDALIRSFGKNFYRKLLAVCIVPFIRPLADKAGKFCELLRPAERLNVLFKNLIGGRRAGSLTGNFEFVGIPLRRNAV